MNAHTGRCAAGMAAHLAGAVAARTTRPVIGIPVSSAALCGMDALFATVQMPPGFPVATVATDSAVAAVATATGAEQGSRLHVARLAAGEGDRQLPAGGDLQPVVEIATDGLVGAHVRVALWSPVTGS